MYLFGAFAVMVFLLLIACVWISLTDSSSGSATETKWSPHCDHHCRVVSSMDLGYTYSAVTYDIDHSQTCQENARQAYLRAKGGS